MKRAPAGWCWEERGEAATRAAIPPAPLALEPPVEGEMNEDPQMAHSPFSPGSNESLVRLNSGLGDLQNHKPFCFHPSLDF